jgi:hypothetical protein
MVRVDSSTLSSASHRIGRLPVPSLPLLADPSHGFTAVLRSPPELPPDLEPVKGGRIRLALREDGRLIRRSWGRFFREELLPRESSDWLHLGGLAAASGYLWSEKRQVHSEVLRTQLYRQTPWVDEFKLFGDWPVVAGVAGILYTTGLLADSPRTRDTGLLLGESLLATGTTVATLQYVLSEERPERGGALRFFVPNGHGASGHAATSMALARVLDHRFLRLHESDGPWKRAGKILGRIGLYGVPALTAWQRIRTDRHYLWNVVLGAGAALYVTNGILRAHERETALQRPPWMPKVSAGPLPGLGGDVRLIWRF